MPPTWAVPSRPDEPLLGRLGEVWGQDGRLPTAERVPPYNPPEPGGASRVPSKVWMSLILAWGWGWIPLTPLPLAAGLILRSAGYLVGLALGISGRGEVRAWDRLGRVLATLAIVLNGINLAWSSLECLHPASP